MNKRIILLGLTIVSSVAIVGTICLTNLSFLNAKANDDIVWYHYAAVAPTETVHGSKEFWASSSDGCTTHTLIDPGQETYIERDFSEYEAFNDISYEDDRFVPSRYVQRNQGMIPAIYSYTQTITYGLYPQTHINDNNLISILETLSPSSNGYYRYNDAYFAKRTANPYNKSYTFDDGTTISKNTTYWFECKPITWNILSSDSGVYYVVSKYVLQDQTYYANTSMRGVINYNNYMYSNIRAWLNGYDGSSYAVNNYSSMDCFYSQAFGLNDSYLTTMTVDNSVDSTGLYPNEYVCDDTLDKVTLLSYEEADSYYFSNNARKCLVTDYALSSNLQTGSENRYGMWWLRSPHTYSQYRAQVVKAGGGFDYSQTNYTYYGARPAITITIV